jgi:hypothetical protein
MLGDKKMKSFLNLLCCLMIMPILAETIGQVEYELPHKIADKWEISNTFESEKSKTVLYVPIGALFQDAKEFFGVNANKYPSKLDNILSFKASLTRQFPSYDVEVDILEKGNDSLLYEWVAKENGKERIHGWGRAFSIGDGTVVLGYQTEEITNVANARLNWLPILKQAKVIQ